MPAAILLTRPTEQLFKNRKINILENKHLIIVLAI